MPRVKRPKKRIEKGVNLDDVNSNESPVSNGENREPSLLESDNQSQAVDLTLSNKNSESDSDVLQQSPVDNTIKCDLCPRVFKGKNNLRRHKKRHAAGKEYCCPYCDVITTDYRSHYQHIETQHRKRSGSSGPPFKCEFCPKEFRRSWNRSQHEKLHTGYDLHTCDVCNKQFPSKIALRYHKTTHLDPSERTKACHLCDQCGKCLSTRGHLNIHKLRVHCLEGKRTYQCEVCGKNYSKRSYLNEHVRTHDSDAVLYLCNENDCNKAFKTKSILKKHIKNVHVIPDVMHACPICGIEFKDKRTVLRHVKTHSDLRDHVCDYCSKSFVQKSNLVAHIRTHTGEKPFPCDVCGRRFTQRTQMKNHVKNVHGSVEKEIDVVEADNDEDLVDIVGDGGVEHAQDVDSSVVAQTVSVLSPPSPLLMNDDELPCPLPAYSDLTSSDHEPLVLG